MQHPNGKSQEELTGIVKRKPEKAVGEIDSDETIAGHEEIGSTSPPRQDISPIKISR